MLVLIINPHPTGGKEYFHSLLNQDFQTDTSKACHKASDKTLIIDNKRLLMPEALVSNNVKVN